MQYTLPSPYACPRTCFRYWALPDPCPRLSSSHASHQHHRLSPLSLIPASFPCPKPGAPQCPGHLPLGNPLGPSHPLGPTLAVSPQNCISSPSPISGSPRFKPELWASPFNVSRQTSLSASRLSFQPASSVCYSPAVLQLPAGISYSSIPWAPSLSPQSGTVTIW